MNDPRLLQLDPQDNVFIAIRTIQIGEELQIGTHSLRITQAIPLGYKIAMRELPMGAKVIKYGVPIGSATVSIAVGEVVHLHNMKSDYLPTFTTEEGHRYGRC